MRADRADHGGICQARASVDRALRHSYASPDVLPASFGQRGLVFTLRSYTALVRSYGLRQEFITRHSPVAT